MLVTSHTGSLRGRMRPGAIGKLKRMTVVAASASPAFWDRGPRPRPSGRRVLVAAAVVALVALAAMLRLRALSAPYWIDEGISVGISSHPLGAIPGVLRQDGSPPLYYLLLHVWMALFGSAPSATHALSAAFAIACVPAAWWAVAPFGTWAGIVAGGLMALDPFVGLYADETRMYSLLLLVALLVCGAFLRAFVLRRRGHLASFAVLLALALYAHPWGAFLVGASGVAWLALLVVGPSRRTLALDGLLAFGGAALLFAPWVPTLLYQAAHTGAPWSHRPTGRSLTRAVARIWSGQRAELVLLPAAALGLALAALRGGRRARRAVLGVAVIGAATLLAAFAYSRFGTPAWALRYLVVVLAPLALLVALGLGRLALLGPLAVLATSLFAWHGRPTVATLEHKSNVTQVARELAPALPRGTLVFSTQPEQVPELAHELPAGMRYATPLGRVADAGVMDWRDALARLDAARFAAVLGPQVHGLRRGARLLLVQPVFSHPDSPWTLKIRDIARRWGHAVRHSRLLHRLRMVRPTHGSSRSTVAAILLERR
jgi:mannosyltransferase